MNDFLKHFLEFVSKYGVTGIALASFLGWVWFNLRVFYPKS